jgi:hypothetical protein
MNDATETWDSVLGVARVMIILGATCTGAAGSACPRR